MCIRDSSRDAAKDTLDIVKEYMDEGMYGGIIHCFSYGKEMAEQYLNMGLYLSLIHIFIIYKIPQEDFL